MRNFKTVIFLDNHVGNTACEFLLKNYFEQLKVIVTKNKNKDILKIIKKYSFPIENLIFDIDLYSSFFIAKLKLIKPDIILLAWWPDIIKEPVLSIPTIGCVNFHPSFLPYNKGKHYNFWTIIEETPFGVTLHLADKGIDSGGILFQKKITKTWEDTGESLYHKARKEILKLFYESYPKLISGNFEIQNQKKEEGSFHYAKELDDASEIFLDKNYTGKDLLNIIRARTFPPFPAAYFYDENGEKYDVRIKITKSDNI